jgi:hypothetical protein
MIGRDERAISRAAAAEHGQTEHGSISSGRDAVSQTGNAFFTAYSSSPAIFRPGSARTRAFLAG